MKKLTLTEAAELVLQANDDPNDPIDSENRELLKAAAATGDIYKFFEAMEEIWGQPDSTSVLLDALIEDGKL